MAAGETGGIVSAANFNSPAQTVISGEAAAVERASELCTERGAKRVVPLQVSAPFHCALMAPAARAVEAELARITLGALAFPVVANVDATPNADSARIPELLVRQIDAPVRWEESVAAIAGAGVTRALEIGPGKVLAGLVKRIDKRIIVQNVFDPNQLPEARAFLA